MQRYQHHLHNHKVLVFELAQMQLHWDQNLEPQHTEFDLLVSLAFP